MSIAGYETYVCMCFFVYKTLCAALIWLPWDARSRPYVCLYCVEKLFNTYNLITKKYWNKNEKHFKKCTKSRDAAVKRTDTRGVGISSVRKSIYFLTTTPSSHTHRFHPLSTIVIHTLNFAQVKSMDDNCGEWVECMGVASGCSEQEAGVASGNGWNL